MPELPEVEVLRRSLEPWLTGLRIRRVEVYNGDLREAVEAGRLVQDCRGRRVLGLRRRAKYLLVDLEGSRTLVVHLGMSGRLTLVDAREPAEAHEHLAFFLESGQRLRFRDPRRFGLVFTAETERLPENEHFSHLGIEPLGPGFDGGFLNEAAGNRRGPVKTFLMDARIVVGVGNIYASEALFRAGVHPTRSVARISSERWNRLAAAVREVLAGAIEEGGTTLNDFADADGQAGYFQVSLSVYGREGEPCPRCSSTVRRTVQANRSTFYCP
ncbi:MAG: bifunctional DNA-formamidopyrimidine glycosylase/DNA-(apurinic or apyrimidinic site) lyase, partial [Acidobacteria bacterium]|nr:bifunctional DNA-formamidopyrimidine glycosylase/DNA-(apurinic or apyrimidinic site) lyase [Acidobacteriota bacterium]